MRKALNLKKIISGLMIRTKLYTYEHHVFLRAKGDLGSVEVGFGCISGGKLSLSPPIDLRRLAAKALVAKSKS